MVSTIHINRNVSVAGITFIQAKQDNRNPREYLIFKQLRTQIGNFKSYIMFLKSSKLFIDN